MTLTHHVVYLATAAIAIAEIGCNVAMVETYYRARGRFAAPLSSKMVAVAFLLAYIALSVLFGDPPLWRVSIALGAVTADGVAILWLWRALARDLPVA